MIPKRTIAPRITILILLIALPITMALAIGVGAVFVPPTEVLAYLIDPSRPGGFLIREYRLPRVLCAVLAGAALAISSVFLQVSLRNDLASPDVVGVSKGAGLGAVITILVVPSAALWLTPIAVVLGGILAVLILFAAVDPRAGSNGVALTGLAVGAIFQAAMMYLVVSSPGDTNQAMIWLAGSLYGSSLGEAAGLFAALVVLTPLIVASSRILDLAKISDESIAGLGRDPRHHRFLLVTVAVLLTAAAVAVVGGIGFLGLLSAHIAIRFVGRKSTVLVPAAALIGAMTLLLADLVGRIAVAPSEVPAGIVTAVLGAPTLLYLLRRNQHVR